jgi:hypothetical protein
LGGGDKHIYTRSVTTQLSYIVEVQATKGYIALHVGLKVEGTGRQVRCHNESNGDKDVCRWMKSDREQQQVCPCKVDNLKFDDV